MLLCPYPRRRRSGKDKYLLARDSAAGLVVTVYAPNGSRQGKQDIGGLAPIASAVKAGKTRYIIIGEDHTDPTVQLPVKYLLDAGCVHAVYLEAFCRPSPSTGPLVKSTPYHFNSAKYDEIVSMATAKNVLVYGIDTADGEAMVRPAKSVAVADISDIFDSPWARYIVKTENSRTPAASQSTGAVIIVGLAHMLAWRAKDTGSYVRLPAALVNNGVDPNTITTMAVVVSDGFQGIELRTGEHIADYVISRQ